MSGALLALSPNKATLIGALLNVGLSIAVIANIAYFNSCRAPLSLQAIFSQSAQFAHMPVRAWVSTIPAWSLLLFLDIPLTLILWRRRLCLPIKLQWLSFAALALGATGFITHSFYSKWRQLETVAYPMYARRSLLHQYGYEIIHSLVSRRNRQRTLVELDLLLAKRSHLTEAQGTQSARILGVTRPNLLVIQVEGFDASVVERRIGDVEIMPFFNEMIRNGIFATRFFAMPCAGHSSDAEFMALTSMFPSAGEPAFFRYAHTRLPSLVRRFRTEGYSSYAAHGFTASFWNRDAMYRNLEFEQIKLGKAFDEMQERIGWGISDRAFLKIVVKDLRDLPNPFSL